VTSVSVTPSTATIYEDQTEQFTATADDQFGNAMATQPTFTWGKVSGIGSISSTGLFSSPSAIGQATVSATSGSLTNTASVTVLTISPTIVAAAAATPSPVTGTTTSLSVTVSDEHVSSLTYQWTTTSLPNGATAPKFSVNSSTAAQDPTVTFYKAGSYTFMVTVTNSHSLTVTSSVSVIVDQTVTSITLSPTSLTMASSTTQQFTAKAFDQFGAAMSPVPTFTWSTTIGQISSAGLLTAPSTGGGGTVTVSSGAATNSAAVTVIVYPTVNAAYLLSDPLQPGKTALFIYGTGSADTILVNPATGSGVAAGSVNVLFNGVSRGIFDPTGSIIIHGIAGNETIGVSPSVTNLTFIFGGKGNDSLWGGGGPTVIVGGTGNNTLYGGTGRSILIGGVGSSVLSSGTGDALLIAGTTNYDATDAALLAILDEWNSADSYATRAADILGTSASGQDLNGAYHLTAATVHASGYVNHLATSGGLALFFQGSKDIVTGKKVGETTVAIS
jgi:hypothetical protein